LPRVCALHLPGPGLYLGKVSWEKKRLFDFVLKF
jgi:hypothetical protein